MAVDIGATGQAVATTAAATRSVAGLQWGDVVALVGAAAWLPQIWKFFQRPKVTPIVGGQIEVGFSELGPIFNPRVAFRVERRDALITGVYFTIVHERGQSTTFEATKLVEIGAESESTSGEKAIHQRTQNVVAIVLTPNAITERKVLTRERVLLERFEKLHEAFGSAIRRLKGQSADWVDRVVGCSEYQILFDAITNDFVWQPGNYSATCHTVVAGQRTTSQVDFQFMLTDVSIGQLQQNIATLGRWQRDTLEGAFDDGTKKAPTFNWVYPMVSKALARDDLRAIH